MNIGKLIKSGLDIVNGNFGKKVANLIGDYFPDPVKKAEIMAKLQELQLERQKAEDETVHVAAQDLNDRIAQYEGTAKDLLALPYIGRVIIFARGTQRPVWGFATLYFDWQLFANDLKLDEQQTQLLWIINFLVLGFLFGERAIKNIMPLVVKFMESKKG